MIDDDRGESFLTVAEVAELLKLNQQTVRNWIDQGSLPAVRVGRRVRIKRSDLNRILDQGYQAGVPPVPAAAGPSAEDFWSGEPVGAAELNDQPVVASSSGGGAGLGGALAKHDNRAATREGTGRGES